MTAARDQTHLVRVGRPVARTIAELLREYELPVRVIDGEDSQVIHLPIGHWTVLDRVAIRGLVEALGWRIVDESLTNDPDGCVLAVGRKSCS